MYNSDLIVNVEEKDSEHPVCQISMGLDSHVIRLHNYYRGSSDVPAMHNEFVDMIKLAYEAGKLDREIHINVS